jgi:hypothetical protein
VLFVVGTISHKMAPVPQAIYDQMTEPKWVVAFGVCTCTGGFYDNYATVQGIDTIIPSTSTSRAARRGRSRARRAHEAPGQDRRPDPEVLVRGEEILQRLRDRFTDRRRRDPRPSGDHTAIVDRGGAADVLRWCATSRACASTS